MKEVDLAFVLDANSRNSASAFKQMKDIVQSIIDKYGQKKIRYAIVTYGATPEIKVKFDSRFNSDEDLKKMIAALPSIDGGSMDKAVEKARKLFEVFDIDVNW